MPSKILFKRLIFVSLVVFAGCAQIHSGNKALQVDKAGNPIEAKPGSLVISGSENLELSSKYFGLIDFTFENISDQWIRIHNIKVYFKDREANKNIVVSSGKDLSLWYKATEKKLLIEQHNKQMALAIIAGLGAGLAIGSNDRNLQTIGGAMALTSGFVLSIDALNKQLDKIQAAGIFPEDHLYARDFFIPPGLFTRKWILLNSKNHAEIGYLKEIYIEYEVENEEKKTILLPFRAINRHPNEWQSDVGNILRMK